MEGRVVPCYSSVVSPRSIILSIAAVAVLGFAIYLYVQVHGERTVSPTPPRRVAAAAAIGDVTPAVAPAAPTVAAVPAPTITAPAPVAAPRQDGSAAADGSANPAHPVPVTPLIRAQTGRWGNPVFGGRVGHAASKADPDQMLDQADKAVAAGELDRAASLAGAVAKQAPGNVRALSLLVTTACAQGKQPVAQEYYVQLPADARGAVKSACSLTLQEPAP
jgi:hypothetical protein